MILLLNPRTNFGCIGAYARSWAVDASSSSVSVRLGMRTRRVNLARVWRWTWRWVLAPVLVVAAIWLLSVLLMVLGG